MNAGALRDFALERYFARWEFAVRHQLSASDVEPLTVRELLSLADDDAQRRWGELTLGYTESSGLPALREEIASMYDGLSPEHVLVVSGAEEGIFLAHHALLTAGDDVVVVMPAYQSLHELARSVGARVVPVWLREEAGWKVDLDALAGAITPLTRAIIINFPHNPTGAHITESDMRRVLQIADDAGAVLLSDEVYRGLEHAPQQSVAPAATLHPRAISLGVMSKSFALPGLRIGWLASRDAEFLGRAARLKDYTTICASAPSEILALIALRARDTVLRRSREIVSANVAHASQFMAAHAGDVAWVRPRAGSTAFPRLLRRSAADVADQLQRNDSVLLMPGTVFDCDASYFRLGLGRRDLPHALSRLSSVLTA